MGDEHDTTEFSEETRKEAVQLLERIHDSGSNTRDVSPQANRDQLRDSLTDRERIAIHQQYSNGHISKEVAEYLLGNSLDEIERERKTLESASELDTTDVFQN